MRTLKVLGLCLLCVSVCITASAQFTIKNRDTNKPRLFATLPERIPVTIDDMNTLFTGAPASGKEVELAFKDRQLPGLRGRVVSSVSKYDNKIRTLIIRSINFSGATLTLSSSTLPDGSVRYSGRIISFQHGDLFELEKQGEQYALVKKNFHDLVSD